MRKFISTFFAIICISHLAVKGQTTTPPQTFRENEAYTKVETTNWYVSSTSVLSSGQSEGNGGGLPIHMIDTKNTTFWSTNWNNTSKSATIIFSLNATVPFDGFYLQQRDRAGATDRAVKGITIFKSDDSASWTQVEAYNALSSSAKYQVLTFSNTQSARYVKLQIDSEYTTQTVFCIAEFGLLQKNNIFARSLLKYNTDDQYPTTPMSKLFDGDNDSYYESNWSAPNDGTRYPHILNTDLGSSKKVNRFYYVNDRGSLYQRAEYGYLKFSQDSITWTDSIGFRFNDSNYLGGMIVFPEKTVRYISLGLTMNYGLSKYNGDTTAYTNDPNQTGNASQKFVTRLNEIAYGYTGETTTPVKFLSFVGKASNNKVLLSWATTTESNADKFELYRSTDGLNFELLTTVKASNNTQGAEYSYIDSNVNAGVYYYKLVSKDLDGTSSSYHDIVKVAMSSAIKLNIKIYPNPVTDALTLTYNQLKNNGTIVIYNVAGQIVLTKNVGNGSGQQTISVSNYPAGLYILKFGDEIIKFIKK